MVTAIVRQRLAGLRNPSRAARLAIALWVVWAVVVWNVVFDRIIVVAGREYIRAAASLSAHDAGSYARMDDWMRPAVTRAFWSASIGSLVILMLGFALTHIAAARTGDHTSRAA